MSGGAIEGGCFCGAIRYRASKAPDASMICHCRSCRRVAGAPAVGWLTFAARAVVFTGEPGEFSSSEPVRRSFCRSCGTQLTYRHAAHSDEIDVATCTLDAPEAFPPTHHSWLSDDLPWVRFGDGLPTYPGSRAD
jgi:hypothetical protein